LKPEAFEIFKVPATDLNRLPSLEVYGKPPSRNPIALVRSWFNVSCDTGQKFSETVLNTPQAERRGWRAPLLGGRSRLSRIC